MGCASVSLRVGMRVPVAPKNRFATPPRSRPVLKRRKLHATLSKRQDLVTHRRRKPETRSFLRWVFKRGGWIDPLEIPATKHHVKRGYRLLFAALEERSVRLRSELGSYDHDHAILRQVTDRLEQERWAADPDRRDWFDRLRAQLERLLAAAPPVWNTQTKRYLAADRLRQAREQLERDPRTARLVEEARDRLCEEAEEAWRRGGQLGKELAEGRKLDPEGKLRRFVHRMRQEGELPAGTRVRLRDEKASEP